MLLVIGYSTEGTIAHTLNQFRKRNIEYHFLDLLSFSSAERISVERSASDLNVQIDDQFFNLNSYSAIYQRCRFHSLDDSSRSKMLSQFLPTLYSFLCCAEALVVNRPCTGSDNHNKFLQVQALKAFGFAVPEQVIIGDPSVASQILTLDGRWINKGCSAFKTSAALVDSKMVPRFGSLAACPSLFQERIIGPDIRVHVVGTETYAVSIRSASPDYRFPTAGEHPQFQPTEISGFLRLHCISWAQANNMVFAGFDFKLRENTGEWLLLEVNPMPGYDMFDKYLAGAISTALGDLLSRSRPKELPDHIESFITSDRRHSIKLRQPQNASRPSEASFTLQGNRPRKESALIESGRSRAEITSRVNSTAALMRPGYAEVHEVLHSLTAVNEAAMAQDAMAAYWLKGFRPAQALCDFTMESAGRGEWEIVQQLMSPDWIQPSMLSRSLSVNEDLVREILSHPHLSPSPATNATRGGGRRLTNLQALQSDHLLILFEEIKQEVERYVKKHQADPLHPVNLFKPRTWNFYSWAIVLGATAFQDWHIHPGSWLSGVYYASIPVITTRSAGCVDGSIQFGLFPPYENHPDVSQTSYCPESGQLLLFPAYFCHRTWPTNVDANRVSISFDLVPNYR
jgi:uncharacterized protein (TIGR02466 family)